MITVKFEQDELGALIGLLTAGAKSPATGTEGIIHAGDLLKKIMTAAKDKAQAKSAPAEPVKQVQAELANADQN